jgi:glycosyltransferase involved in cell wall biosynthesis
VHQRLGQPPDFNHPLRSAVIGVLVHNEEPNIERCLRAILDTDTGSPPVGRVLVIASACTDQTELIVRRVAAEDPRVQILIEAERSGKASALNLLLLNTSAPILVMLGGDVIFTPGSLARLLEPFQDPSVGMTGARPIPTNARAGVVGHAVNILWDVHHEVSLYRPKLGEAVAFRRVLREIDRDTLVDEALIEHVILRQGLRLQYVPTALVRNHGPETLREFISQRKRIYAGHLALSSATHYRVSSMNVRAATTAAWRLWRRGHSARYLLATMALEAAARGAAHFDRLTGRDRLNGVWRPIASSKRVLAAGHVLRSHHDDLQSLRLRRNDPDRVRAVSPDRAVVALVKGLVRTDDRIITDRGGVTIVFPGDKNGARTVGTRLQSRIPGLATPEEP